MECVRFSLLFLFQRNVTPDKDFFLRFVFFWFWYLYIICLNICIYFEWVYFSLQTKLLLMFQRNVGADKDFGGLPASLTKILSQLHLYHFEAWLRLYRPTVKEIFFIYNHFVNKLGMWSTLQSSRSYMRFHYQQQQNGMFWYQILNIFMLNSQTCVQISTTYSLFQPLSQADYDIKY